MNNKIIEKIQKLLALAQSSNANEAQIASQKAMELMYAHNISMQQVKSHTNYVNKDFYTSKKYNENKNHHIFSILQDYFFVKVVLHHRYNDFYFHILGEEDNVIVAHYVFDFLYNRMTSLYKEYKATRLYESGMETSWNYGFYKGLDDKLEQTKQTFVKEQNNSKALIVIANQLDVFARQVFPNLRKSSSSSFDFDRNAYDHGIEKGKNTTISMGITNKPTYSHKYLT